MSERENKKKTGGNLEEIKFKVSECALHVKGENGSCTPVEIEKRIVSGMPEVKNLEEVQRRLRVKKESELYEHPMIVAILGEKEARKALKYYFKAKGPAKSTELLDNFNIDETLELWSVHGEKLFGKKFYHIPFQMIDFDREGTELAKVDLYELMKSGYDSFGVVLNTDVSSGRGKHWFCLYGELGGDKVTIEYFNSSGRAPMDSVREWIEKTAVRLREKGVEVEEVRVVDKRLQKSDTECGMWSLMYILLRLKGKPSSWFYDAEADDKEMIALREYMFRE